MKLICSIYYVKFMILKNITSSLILSVVLLASLLSGLVFGVSAVQAQTEPLGIVYCPINGEISANFENPAKERLVDNLLLDKVRIVNSSEYTFGGVRLGLAVYQSVLDDVPTYWMVLPEEHQVLPKSSLFIPVAADLSGLPAGEYELKVFAVQGDETTLLGSMLRNAQNVSSITLDKTSEQTRDISVLVSVNEQDYQGQTIVLGEEELIEVIIKTTNHNNFPVIDYQMLGVVAQGDTPLGTAVRAETLDAVTIVPGRSRITGVNDRYVERGKYTVFAGLIGNGALNPLVAVPVQIADTIGNTSWSYVSQVGLSTYPLQDGSQVIACVENVGANEGTRLIHELLGVQFIITDQSKELGADIILSTDDKENYFTFIETALEYGKY